MSARPRPARAAAPTASDAAPARPTSGSAPARGRRASRETTSPLSQEEAGEAAARAGTDADIGRPRRLDQAGGRSPEPGVPEPSPDAVDPPAAGGGGVAAGGGGGGGE